MIVWITIPLIVGLYIGYTAHGLIKTLNLKILDGIIMKVKIFLENK